MAGFGCFVFACVLSVLCLGTYLYVRNLPYYVYYTFIESVISQGMLMLQCYTYVLYVRYDECLAIFKHCFFVYLQLDKSRKHTNLTKEMLMVIVRNCWMFALILLLICSTSQMVYPGAVALIEPANPNDSDWHQVYFSQV